MTPTLEDLGRRVAALEKAQNTTGQTMTWIVGTLGKIQAAVDDHTATLADHTVRLDRIEHEVGELRGEVGGLRVEVRTLRADMPGIVADAMRDVMRKS